MKLYENIFIARQDLAPAQVEALAEKFGSVVKDQGGSVGKVEYCGLRTLAYLIKKNRRGHYVLMNITAAPTAMAEVERLMRINEDILRFQTIRMEEHEKGPSSLLKASRYQRDEFGGDDRDDEAEDVADDLSDTPSADELN